MVHLPYFLPEDYTGMPVAATPAHARPYIAAAGRLEQIKGFQDAIDAVRHLPGLDLRILCDTLGVALRGEHRHEERLRRGQAWLRDQQTAVPPEMEMAGAMS